MLSLVDGGGTITGGFPRGIPVSAESDQSRSGPDGGPFNSSISDPAPQLTTVPSRDAVISNSR